MLQKIPFKAALYITLLLCSLVLVFHFLILSGLIPYNLVWGGKLKELNSMYLFESISICINFLLLFCLLQFGNLIPAWFPHKLTKVILWVFIVLFALNTVGNLLSETSLETIIFTPITFVLSLLCFRIVYFNYVEQNNTKPKN